MQYTFTDLIWLFFIYSFAGWRLEICYAAVHRKGVVNRGFVNSPVCPIYGFSAVLFALFLPELTEKPFFLFLGGMLLGRIPGPITLALQWLGIGLLLLDFITTSMAVLGMKITAGRISKLSREMHHTSRLLENGGHQCPLLPFRFYRL